MNRFRLSKTRKPEFSKTSGEKNETPQKSKKIYPNKYKLEN